MPRLRTIECGLEHLPAGACRARHRHREAYAIVVLAGGFEQAGYAGRLQPGAGDLLIQPALDAHANWMPRRRGATILRLPWHDEGDLGGLYALADADAVARAAERDLHAATSLAREQWALRTERRLPRSDLPDLLARELAAGQVASLSAWAEHAGVARESLSRAFRAAYGVSARQLRLELRTRAAWVAIRRTCEPLSAIALAAGFADQAHMTRSVRALTGAPPMAWRHAAERARRQSSRREDPHRPI